MPVPEPFSQQRAKFRYRSILNPKQFAADYRLLEPFYAFLRSFQLAQREIKARKKAF